MNGTDLFSSPPKQPPKVQVGHPPLPPFKEIQEDHILEISGPTSSFQEDQLRDALEALCDRLNGRDAGYFFDSSGVRTFMVLQDSNAVDDAIANRDRLIVDPIHPHAQEALSVLTFSKANESFELREFVNFASSGAGMGATLSPLSSPRPFGGMNAPLSFSALPPPVIPVDFPATSRVTSPRVSALGLLNNPRTPSPPRKHKTTLELGLESLAQQWGSPSPERAYQSIGSPRNTPLGAKLFMSEEITRGRGRGRERGTDMQSNGYDLMLPAAKRTKRQASTEASRVVAADVLNDLMEKMRCELCSELMVDPHALTSTHCGHSFCCLCIIRHILDSWPVGVPNPAHAPELIKCPSCEIDGSPPGSPSPSPSPGSRRGLISRQTTLASVVSSVYETLLQEEVEGWVPPNESKRTGYDQRVKANAEALVDWNACWSSSGDFSQLKEKLARS
ncbi:hypothetical protein FRC08_006990 [Ceratobasidium sp. 394]|nr:hypothetical protein FRC08_006990 [Ceratobasidium sp. 394]